MRNKINNIRARHAAGEIAIGATVQMASPESIEMVGIVGYDFVWIDAEHGTMDLTTLVELIRAADAVGITSVVRVPDHSPSFISRTLDAGALGILAPRVRNKTEAENLVKAIKYGPSGERGACHCVRASGHFTEEWKEYRARADRDTMLWVLIEDQDGADNIEEIVSVPGVDAVLFGPFDMSQALGYEGDIANEKVRALLKRVQEATSKAGVELISMAGWEPGGLDGVLNRKAKIVLDGVDRQILISGFRRYFEQMRARLRSA